MQLKYKKKCAVCGEGAVMVWMYQKWFVKFCAGDLLLDIHGQVDQLRLKTIKLRLWLRTINILYAGDSWHTQNIQINKVMGESEKCVIYFMEN